MAALIKIRRDTAANWATNNPILGLGEPGLELDTRKVKYGDGASNWNTLQYQASTYVLPTASISTVGGVRIDGTSITISPSGIISASVNSQYQLPTATTSILGGVKIDGASINIDQSGTISTVPANTRATAAAIFTNGINSGISFSYNNLTGVMTTTVTGGSGGTGGITGLTIQAGSVQQGQANAITTLNYTAGGISVAGAVATIGSPTVLSSVTSLAFATGVAVNTISADTTLAANSDSVIPTQKAVKGYVDAVSPQYNNVSLTGNTTIQRLYNVLNNLTGATGDVEHDVDLGTVWYHTFMISDFVVDIINVASTNDRSIKIILYLEQGAIPYVPTGVKVNLSSVPLLWVGGTPPTGTANGVDTVEITLINHGTRTAIAEFKSAI